jgi:hypothetical protein
MASHRERDDDYGEILAQLGPDWRVIVCKDDHQWIVQQKPKGGVWRSKHYCTSREGALRRVKGLPGREALTHLPARFNPSRTPQKPRTGSHVDTHGYPGTLAYENALRAGLR